MDSNCNTRMTTHTARLLLLLLDQTRASSAMLILIGRLFGFQFCIFTTLSTQNKNGALNKSCFQRKWSKNNKIEKKSWGPRLGPRFPAPKFLEALLYPMFVACICDVVFSFD